MHPNGCLCVCVCMLLNSRQKQNSWRIQSRSSVTSRVVTQVNFEKSLEGQSGQELRWLGRACGAYL